MQILSSPKGRSAASAFLALLCGWLLLAVPSPDATARNGSSPKPNFVVIQTDDQTYSQLYATFNNGAAAMPNTLLRIAARGVTFPNYYATYPLCCPSRTSLLTGRYAHNHGVVVNYPPYGYYGYRVSPAWTSNLAVWLQHAGYQTAHVGKFMNQYGEGGTATEVPPGWNHWVTPITDHGARIYYGYRLNVDGEIVGPFGSYEAPDPAICGQLLQQLPCNYKSDVESRYATEAITEMAQSGQPFYLQLDLNAPHDDVLGEEGPQPATRNSSLSTTEAFRPPGYDELFVSDKPRFLRRPPMSAELKVLVDTRWRNQLETLRSADDAIGRVLDALETAEVADRTYVVFVSDNGFFHGQLRLGHGKYLPHEPSARVPFVIAGPGIAPGTAAAPAANVDIAPTLLHLASLGRPPMDGRSLVPFIKEPNLQSRRPIVLEGFTGDGSGIKHLGRNAAPVVDYRGVVLGGYKFVRYWNGAKELYDLRTDPNELHNLVRRRRWWPVRQFLTEVLGRYQSCTGSACSRPVREPLPRPRRG